MQKRSTREAGRAAKSASAQDHRKGFGVAAQPREYVYDDGWWD
jgi:hypothetical protein